VNEVAPPLPGLGPASAATAPKWTRIVASVVDLFVISLLAQVLRLVGVHGRWFTCSFIALATVLALAFFLSPLRATPGMVFTHIRLCGADGSSSASVRAVVRRTLCAATFGLAVVVTWWGALAVVAALAVAWGPTGATAWDRFGPTRVVPDWRPGRFR
jgi:RDD family